MKSRVRAYIGLGSNQDEPVATIRNAIGGLRHSTSVDFLACSSLYRCAPVGYLQQPDFINAVCEIDTDLPAPELLALLQSLEQQAGRIRVGIRWGPRTLDLDLLLYGDTEVDTSTLALPHPRMHERAFVLYPLQEIAPDLVVPGHGPVAELVKNCADQRCTRIDS